MVSCSPAPCQRSVCGGSEPLVMSLLDRVARSGKTRSWIEPLSNLLFERARTRKRRSCPECSETPTRRLPGPARGRRSAACPRWRRRSTASRCGRSRVRLHRCDCAVQCVCVRLCLWKVCHMLVCLHVVVRCACVRVPVHTTPICSTRACCLCALSAGQSPENDKRARERGCGRFSPMK